MFSPLHDKFDGTLQITCGSRNHQHVHPRRTFAAEATTDVMADHANVFLGNGQALRQEITGTVHPLRRCMKSQPIVIPFCHYRVRLHGMVMEVRSDISGINFDSTSVPGISNFLNSGSLFLQMRFLAIDRVGWLQLGCRQRRNRLLFGIFHVNKTRSLASLFVALGNHIGNVLPVIMDRIICQPAPDVH